MAAYRRCDKNDVEETKASGRKSREKPALSPIEEEETDSPDSSGDSVINFRGIDHTDSSKKLRYDLLVGLSRDYEEAARDLEEEVEEKRIAESPPFLTARNGSEDETGSKSGDSSATASCERSTPEDEPDDSSAPGESTSGEAVFCYDDDEEDDSCSRHDHKVASFTEMKKNIKIRTRSKSAPASIFEDFSSTNRDDRIEEISTIVDLLRIRIVKSESEINRLKKQLRVERLRSYKYAKRYDEDVNLTKESLRLDLEMWIKKLNDGLRSYLAEWQRRERLRMNEEISRISDLYSQEITKSLRASLRDWQIEESRKMLEAIETRDKLRQDRERSNTRAVYEKIQIHLENLNKRNRKSCESFRKQIDKWEDRLRDEVVKLHEENLKKLRDQVDKWCEESRPEAAESPPQLESGDEKPSLSFPGADALIQVEENLLKRLRDSSSKDLRRTEQIVRTELKAQRRELAKRMNDKISELWTAFEEFGCVGFDRSRSRRSATSGLPAPPVRNDLEAAALGKDSILNPDVLGGRSAIAGKIVGAIRTGGSTRSTTDVEDGDRDYCEDDDDDDDDEHDSLPEDVGKGKITDRSSPSPS